MQFSLQAVRDVARLLRETELSEITVEDVDAETGEPFRVALKRSTQAPALAASSQQRTIRATSTQDPAATARLDGDAGTSQPPATAAIAEEPSPTAVAVTSTAVGLFRQASPPLQVGDTVQQAQVVAIVESLKIPNEITAPLSGRVENILVEDGQGIEYGQTLLTIMPDASA
ncbi:MAG TPA: biotin/lipoyl-containing protein [Abditibacteriaceae bacterium]|jgi:acetyl-CoA carboxylase biotin carboxyl carrier protein